MKKQRRSDVTTEIVVGAFMFIVLLALVTFTIVLSQNKFFEKHHDYTVHFTDVGGLREGEPVFMRGVKVGNVERIQVADYDQGVDVALRLTLRPDLRDDYNIQIKSASMLGGMLLDIYEGSENASPFDDSTRLKGSPIRDVMAEAGETIGLIRQALTDGGVLDNVKTMTKNLAEMSESLNNGTGTVTQLIHNNSLYVEAEALVKSFTESSDDFQVVAKDLQIVSARLAAGEGVIGKLLSEDEALYADLTNTMANVSLTMSDLSTIMDRVERGEGTIGSLLSSDDEVYEDLAATLASLRDFSSSLSSKEGTIGLLLSDDALYKKVVGLIDEARATVDDLRETSPITTFSSIFMGAF